MDATQFNELQTLCEAAVEGRLTGDSQQRLEQLVLGSDEARRFYVAYLHQHAELQWAAADPEWLAAQSSSLASVSDTLDRDPARPSISSRVTPWRKRVPWQWRWVSIAALAAALLIALWLPQRSPSPLATVVGVDNGPEEPLDFTVAVLVHAPDAQWGGDERPRLGAPLAPGWLRLQAGLAQLEFYSGATVIVEGPAEVQLISRMEAFCARGKLRVTVPPQAHGFAIGTPKLDLVDLGTEFGVHVDERKATEVHVFTGKVELYDAGSNRAVASRKELTTGQGLLVNEQEQSSPLASNPAAFQNARDLVVQSAAQARRRYETWLAASQELRNDPGLVAYYPIQADDAWSRTLSDRAGNAAGGQDGAIVGCTWGEGRWPLKQSLEFKQVSDRVRVSIPGEFESLTLAAWVRIDSLPNLNNSLIMADGWEPGEVHWQIGASGMLILGVQSEPKGKGWHYDAPDVITPDHFGRWTHLAVVYNRDAGLVTHYLNGRPVAVQSIPMDILLRLGDAEIGNWNISTHRNITPVRYFTGGIDEVTVFSRALSEAELEKLYEQGQSVK